MALRFKASLNDTEFDAGLRRMEAGAVALGSKLRSAFNVGGAIGIGGAIGGGLALGSLTGTMDRLSDIKDQAAAIDLPIEEFQRLSFAMGQSGVKAETFQKGMANLTESFVKARDATSAQGKAMETLGLSLKTTNESDATNALSNLADAYVQSSDKGAAFAAVADLVGAKVAIKMVPALVDGGAELRRLASSATIASEEMVKFGEEMGDKFSAGINTAKNRITGGWYAIGVAAKKGFEEGVGKAKDIGLPGFMQTATGLTGAVFRGTMGGNEGAVDEERLKSIEEQAKAKEAKQKAVEKGIEEAEKKRIDDVRDHERKQYVEFMSYREKATDDLREAERKQYSDLIGYREDQEEKLDQKLGQLARAREADELKAAKAIADEVNAQIEKMDSAREKIASGIRANPHHFAADAKREQRQQEAAERKADRLMGITPDDRKKIGEVQKLVNNAPKNMEAKIAAESIKTLVAEIGKLIAK